MNDYCVPLNLDIEPLDNITIYEKLRYQNIPIHRINTRLHEFFNKHKLTISSASLFYKGAPDYQEPHTDMTGGDYVKLNYVYGGRGSKMIWFKPINSTVKNSQYLPKSNGPAIEFTQYKFNEVTKIHEQSIIHPSIVQVGIPHTILNMIEPRRCLTIIIRKNNERVTMSEIKFILKDYLL